MAVRDSDFSVIRMWPREIFLHRDGRKLAAQDIHALTKAGVYILYRDDDPYYIGKADILFRRLHDHSNKITDRHFPLWNYFSAFAFNRRSQRARKKILELEGILIAAMPRVANSAKPRWKREVIPQHLRSVIKESLGQGVKAMTAAAGKR